MIVLNPSVLNGYFTQYDARFSEAYAKYAPAPWGTKLSMAIPSHTSQNVYAWLAQLPQLRQWIGARQAKNLSTRSYVLPNQKFELTLEIPRTTLEDDQYDIFGPWMDQAAYQARKWPDQLLAQMFLNGNTANNGTAFDGQNFFSTTHPIDLQNLGAGTQSNYYASGYPLSFDNYAKVRANMMGIIGEGGNPLGLNPSLLVVPPALEGTARLIAEADFAGFSALNGNSQVGPNSNIYKGTTEVIVIPELASQPTSWYLLDTHMPVMPFIWQLRNAPETVYRNQLTDEHVFSTDNFLYGIRARGAAGFGLWQLAVKASA